MSATQGATILMGKDRWSKRAITELFEIGDYIARDKPVAAREWAKRIRKRAHDAADAPLLGRFVPGLDRPDVREVFLRSYRIVYRITSYGIFVLTVFEGHMCMRDIDPDENA